MEVQDCLANSIPNPRETFLSLPSLIIGFWLGTFLFTLLFSLLSTFLALHSLLPSIILPLFPSVLINSVQSYPPPPFFLITTTQSSNPFSKDIPRTIEDTACSTLQVVRFVLTGPLSPFPSPSVQSMDSLIGSHSLTNLQRPRLLFLSSNQPLQFSFSEQSLSG